MKKNHPFLKIAGVKNIDEFYQKFPTEESFMAKYGKQLKKADNGFAGLIKPNAMPNVDMINLGNTKGFGLTKLDSTSLTPPKYDYNPLLQGVANNAGTIMAGIQKIGQEKKDIAELQKYGKVSDVVAKAAGTKPERVKRKYVRPEDNLIQGSNPLGTGTNYLAAENGAEIQNTYAPDVMYTDLGYEPLNDSNPKQYKKGGKLKKAANGFDMFSGIGGQLGGMAGSALGGGTGDVGAGAEIGSSIGGLASFIPGIGPAAGLIGSTLGGAIGGLFDAPRQKQMKEAKEKLQKNLDSAMLTSQIGNVQASNSSFMEDGGWVSNDWQPQVIASFGEHSMKQLLKPDPTMNTLRAGGHLKEYTAPSASAMYTGRDLPYQMEDGGQMAMGGDLQVHRGEAETLSYNPFLPNNGETVMFRGPSHDDGGMPISYGQNGVEVEGGEPAQVMKDGGTQDNLVVFGNMEIPDYGANEIGDPKAKGMKFKRYIADLSKQEAKQNKITDVATSLLNSSDTNDPFEQLSFNSGQAMLKGSSMKLKNLADKKQNVAAVQNAILETAEEHGIDSAKLAKQKLAKFGGKFTSSPIAQGGITLAPIAEALPSSYIPNLDEQIEKARGIQRFTNKGNPIDLQDVSVTPSSLGSDVPTPNFTKSSRRSSEGPDWWNAAGMAMSLASPFLKPKLDNTLDPNQLTGEMMAMAMNQVEPVQAQTYQPMLSPEATSFSLQDQLNEVTAQSRAAERLAQGNPAALAMIASQAQQAKSKILGEQFRMNQAEKQRVAEANRNVLNDAQLKNLAVYDQQYARQSEAKSKTKSQAIEVAKSIADKIAKNKLENRQLRTMENMYPAFNFTSDGTVYKNPFYQAMLNTSGSGKTKGNIQGLPSDWEALYNTAGEFRGTKKLSSKDDDGDKKNGGIVKAFKNF